MPVAAALGTPNNVDVVVIGAGLAGLCTARSLADARLSVLLVDRKPSITYGIHTSGIFVRRTFDEFDLPGGCLGSPIRHVNLYSPAGTKIELQSPRPEFRIGRMERLYAEMLKRCRRAGVRVLLETTFESSVDRSQHLLVSLRQRAHSIRVASRFLIGADGAQSQVAEDLNLSLNRKWIVGVEHVYRNAPPGGPPSLHCFLDPLLAPGYLCWIAHDRDEVHLGVAGNPARFRPLQALQRFRKRAANVVNLDAAEFIENRGGRIPVGGVLPRIASRRGLLVGDAAGAVSPLTAGGLDPCLRLSRLASSVAAQFLTTGDESVLNVYNGKRFRRRFLGRRLLRSLLEACRHPWIMEAGCQLLRTSPGRAVAARLFFGDFSFPDPAPRLQPIAPIDASSSR